MLQDIVTPSLTQPPYFDLYPSHLSIIAAQDMFWEEAASHYLRAGRFLASDVYRDQSDLCFEQAGYCYMQMEQQLEDASFIFETLAESCMRTNLRRFQARDYLFKSILCLIGIPMPDPEVEEDKEDDEDELAAAIIVATEEKYHNIIWKVFEFEMVNPKYALLTYPLHALPTNRLIAPANTLSYLLYFTVGGHDVEMFQGSNVSTNNFEMSYGMERT